MKKLIESKLQGLRSDSERILANYNATIGAISVLQAILKEAEDIEIKAKIDASPPSVPPAE